MLNCQGAFKCSSFSSVLWRELPVPRPAACASSRGRQRRRAASAQPAAARSSGDNKPQQAPSAGVIVRPLQASDKARWQVLFNDYIAWYKSSVPDDTIELCWQRLMEGGEGNHICLVAQQEPSGLVVGLAHVLLHRSTWCATHYCYLEDLYVDGTARAQGVGRALIQAVYRLADERGAPKVYWQTQEQNYRARGLYDTMGRKSQFILYERERCAIQASADAALLAPMHPEQHKQNQTF
ncbi:acyl-CoA N-acyltransferase [Scenedesmus sp. NREL 46B-D3]|nr:acyl-CoA N-acyltransferase [Scenedesmus sp. NREL 46B-D3]